MYFALYFYWLGLGLGDILKPELVMPLIETLPLEQLLASYLPEVGSIVLFEFSLFSDIASVYDSFKITGSMVSRGYPGVAAEPTIPSASRFIYLCKNLELYHY